MFTVILRSVCVGIATTVAVFWVGTFVWVSIAAHSWAKNARAEGGGEIGWDLVSMVHNTAPSWFLLPLLVFATGFFFGFRYFSKSLARK